MCLDCYLLKLKHPCKLEKEMWKAWNYNTTKCGVWMSSLNHNTTILQPNYRWMVGGVSSDIETSKLLLILDCLNELSENVENDRLSIQTSGWFVD